MNPWVILSLQLSSGQLKIEAEDSGGHRFPAARPWVGVIPATALRGAGLNTQTEVLVPEVWPPQAGVVYLRLPASIASRDWDPLIRIVLGHAASVARYVATAVGGIRPFELPLRIVSMNQVRPYLNAFLSHNWVKETQRRGGLEINFTADALETLHRGTWHVLLTPEKRLGHVLSGIGTLPARRRPALVLSVPEGAAEAVTLPTIPSGTTLYRFSKQATGRIQEGIDSWMHDLIHFVPWTDIVATKAGTIYTGPYGVQGIHMRDIAEQLENRQAYARGLAETIRLLKPGTEVNMPSVPSRIDLRFDREATSIEPATVSLQDLSVAERDLKQRIPATLTPEQEQVLTDKQQRRVDIAFRGATPPHDYIHPTGHLTTGGECLVCVRVGQAFEISVMGSPPPPIDPLLPKRKTGHRLQVVLFAKNATVKGAASRTLTLPQFGPSNRLAFRVLLPKNSNTLDARLSVYYRNQLLQSFLILADTGGIRAELDFSQTSRFQNLAAFERRKASLAVNSDAAATHTVMLVAEGISAKVAFPEGAIQRASEDFKEYLAGITGTAQVPKFDTYPQKGAAVPSEFHDSIRRAAYLGFTLWTALMAAAGDDKKFKDALYDLREGKAHEETIQVVRFHSNYSYPWQILYDWQPPHPDHPRQNVCLGTVNGSPCKHGFDSGVYCINGFWSMRYVIEQLIGSGNNLQDIAVETSVKNTTGAVLLSADEKQDDLEELCTELKGQLKKLDSESDLVEQIWNPATRPAIALIYGHTEIGELHGQKDVVRITLAGNQKLFIQDLWKNRPLKEPRPAVFLLACQTTMVDPGQLSSFLAALQTDQFAAILGTEWLAFRSLLARFAREMTLALWKGTKLGPAMRDFRRDLLIAGNPLPFAFQAIGSSDYHLKFEEHR